MRTGIPKEKMNFVVLFLTMLAVCLVVAGAAISILYHTAFAEERLRLTEHAQSQAYLMEAVARFDAQHSIDDHPDGARGATISQIKDAHSQFESFSNSGEFLIGSLENQQIHFLLSHQRYHLGTLPPVPMDSSIAEPMRRALLGQNGTMVGPDYRNVTVLAAYHPVPSLKLGIVVKIDLAEIRAPFLYATGMVSLIALIAITLGALFFFRISNPIITQMQKQDDSLRKYADQISAANSELKITNQELNKEIIHRQQITEALQASDEHVRLLLNSTTEGIYGLDTSGNCTFVNAAALHLLGYTKDTELLGKNMHDCIHHTDEKGNPMPESACNIFKAFQSGKGCHNDQELLWRADGTSFAAEYWSYPVMSNDQIIGAVVTFFDISDRKRTEQQLQTSLDEKETLLKEIHHRVKNNMQIISSLLTLQAQKADDPKTQKIVAESQNRIKAMALIHEKLYRNHNLGAIDFADYLQDLTAHLNRSHGQEQNRIAISIQADRIFLPIDTAIPCGLIVNELITNAIKHGFSEDHPGEIQLNLHQQPGSHVLLSVQDNGCGVPADFDIGKAETLGLTLVANLARQLNATLEFRVTEGFECALTFTSEVQEGDDG